MQKQCYKLKKNVLKLYVISPLHSYNHGLGPKSLQGRMEPES